MAVAAPHRGESGWGSGSEVCGALCDPAGGNEYSSGSLEFAGRYEPLAG